MHVKVMCIQCQPRESCSVPSPLSFHLLQPWRCQKPPSREKSWPSLCPAAGFPRAECQGWKRGNRFKFPSFHYFSVIGMFITNTLGLPKVTEDRGSRSHSIEQVCRNTGKIKLFYPECAAHSTNWFHQKGVHLLCENDFSNSYFDAL